MEYSIYIFKQYVYIMFNLFVNINLQIDMSTSYDVVPIMTDPLPAEPRASRPNRFSRIVSEIGDAIANGSLAPGAQIPTRKVLALRHRTTVVTVQKALAHLEQTGQVVSRGWQGTFVSDAPPCRHRFALLLRDRISEHQRAWVPLYQRQLARTAAELTSATLDIPVYEGLATPTAGDLAQLIADAQRRMLAGVISVDVDPREFPPLLAALDAYRTPIVDLGPHEPQFTPWQVAYDHRGLRGAILETLREHGCRRPIMAFSTHGCSEAGLLELQEQAAALGLPLPPGYALGLAPEQPLWIRQWLRLLLDLPACARPDGIAIADEHLAAPILAVLAEVGMDDRRGLPVVCHTNFPEPSPPGTIPCGFDLRIALQLAIDLARESRQPGNLGRRVLVPPRIGHP